MPRSAFVRASLPLAALAASASLLGAQHPARAADAAFLRQLHAAGALRLVAPLVPAADAADPARPGAGSHRLGDILWVAGGGAALVASVVLADPDSPKPRAAATVIRPPAGEPPPAVPGPAGGSGLDKPAAPTAPPPPPPPSADPTMHVAPEPGTVLLVATGLAGLALLSRRRRR